MTMRRTCACGNPADSFSGQCDRCIALQTMSLGISASQEQIEDMYHTLVKVWHPDRFGANPELKLTAEEKLKEINAAHDYLKPMEMSDSMAHEPRKIPRIIVNAIYAGGSIAVIALLCFVLDAFLSSNQSTAASWARSKAELSHDVHAGAALWSTSKSPTQPQGAETPNPPSPQHAGSPEEKRSASQVEPSEQSMKATPYITAGLTPAEVISALGPPTSSSGARMFFKGSEIYFEDGQVAGWKIDPKTAPIRVRLWPDAAPEPGMTTFDVGSSKSDVIAIQGTPTLFSRNEFGYGNSLVFFQNDHVVSWKEDPASVPLKVAH